MKPDEAISFKDAVILGKHGQYGNGRKKESRGDNVTSTRGNQADYTIARLQRDNPELAERVRNGELSAALPCWKRSGRFWNGRRRRE